MAQNEIEYLNRRAQQHRERSTRCDDPATQRLHERFAASYTARASQLAGRATA